MRPLIDQLPASKIREVANAAIGRTDRAADDLAAYLEHMPQAEDRGAIAERLRALRSAGRPRLH